MTLSCLLFIYLFSLLWFAVILSFIYICYCAVVLFCSREHENCGPQPGYVRAHIESKLFYTSAFDELKRLNHFEDLHQCQCYIDNSDTSHVIYFDILRWRIQYFPTETSAWEA